MIASYVVYDLIETTCDCDGIIRVCYGIAVYTAPCRGGTFRLFAVAKDIASDPQAVLSLIERCNRLHLSPMHFFDVVEDSVTRT